MWISIWEVNFPSKVSQQGLAYVVEMLCGKLVTQGERVKDCCHRVGCAKLWNESLFVGVFMEEAVVGVCSSGFGIHYTWQTEFTISTLCMSWCTTWMCVCVCVVRYPPGTVSRLCQTCVPLRRQIGIAIQHFSLASSHCKGGFQICA